ncbi:hypothetical protein Ddc_20180 [Ditylenchus destructor]|nr:hypothetical protein Ddc_20180 [Ditylenchus destructor]
MQSRVKTIIPPEKRHPSVFKALCLPNTGFMVDFLGFFTRDDFEKYLQLTCNRMNQLVLTHFPSKPYRYLEDVTLECNMCNLYFDIELCLSKPTPDIRFSTICWDPYQLKWRNFCMPNYVGFSAMLPFLDKTVRVPKFTTPNYLKDNLTTRTQLLSTAKLFRCRRFKCSYMDDVMLPLWDYPEIYSMEAVEVNFGSDEIEESDMVLSVAKLVENRALYPNSQTTFVFSEDIYLYCPAVIQHICNKFTESDKAQSFQIIFAVRDEYESSDRMNEFRFENNRTREVLHLRSVTHSEVSKYCEFNSNTKYFVLERSLV